MGRLAFVQSGDIWIKRLPDGEPQRLTTDGVNQKPRWSPSGEWLAFFKGDELWVVQASGANARALSPSTPVNAFAWSPLADTLAYTTRTGTLHAVGAAEWREQELVANASGQEGTGVLSLAWSPDGEWLAFSRDDILKESQQGQFPERKAGLWIIRADGSRSIERFTPGMPSEYGLAVAGWSADGQYVLSWIVPVFSASLLADGTSLIAMPALGGEPSQIIHTMLAYPGFVAPDASGTDRLAVVDGGGRAAWTEKALRVVSASTGETLSLTRPDMAVSSPSWLPDGQRLAFAAMPDQDGLFPAGGEPARQMLMLRHVFVVDLQGRVRQLTADPGYRDERPLSSADGNYLLFVRLNEESRVSLWLMPTQGGEAHQVVDELTPNPGWFGYYAHIDWDSHFDWWREPVPKPAPTATPFPVAIYPSPFPLAGPWRATAGCPNPEGLEEFEFGMPVETVTYMLEELWSGDLEGMRRVTDPALWPLLVMGEGQVGSVLQDQVRTRQPASASPYADIITARCGMETMKLTWWVEAVCPRLCALPAGSQSRVNNVFLVIRNGQWLIWAID